MYKLAESEINKGLSLTSRIILGLFSGIFGVVMFLVAPPTDKALFFYIFGGFCLLIAIACLTLGRLRQFVGSTIGCLLFVLSILYFADQLIGDTRIFSTKSEPSLINSILFIFAFGIPGASYAIKTKFGFANKDEL